MFFIDLPVAGIPLFWPGILLLGLCIGFLTGMFGVGGGFLLTPLLNIFFGIPFPIAVGSSLVQIFITASLSSWSHWKRGNVDVALGSLMAVGAFAGTELGIRLLSALTGLGSLSFNGRLWRSVDLILPVVYLVLMISIAISIIVETSRVTVPGDTRSGLACRLQRIGLFPILEFTKCDMRISAWIPVGMSVLVGILTGLLGVGGGFVNFPLLVYALGVPTFIAVGTSSFQVLFATAYGSVRNLFAGNVELVLVAFSTAGSLLGVQLGVIAIRKIGGREIRRLFSLVILVGVVIILQDLVRKLYF